MTDYIEERRAQAREHRGVWYDSRADKFVAEVYSRGDRHFLGHFPTAEEAADAYTAAREELPSGRGGEDSFVHALQSFLDTCARDTKNVPLRDEVLTYKDQQFFFESVVFRSMKNRKRPFYKWLSTCATCGTAYETLTATTPGVAKGITRNCEEHRKGARPTTKVHREPRTAAATILPGEAPQEWIDVAHAATEALSLVSDSFTLPVFLQECWGAQGQPEGFIMFLAKSPKSPVFVRGGELFPRST